MKGSYCLVLSLNSEVTLSSRGRRFSLPPGTYVYCGSALGSLDARVERHIHNFNGGKVRQFWHIDFLLPFSGYLSIVKAPSGSRAECRMVSLLSTKGLMPVPCFGNSDCSSGCKGHLLRAEGPAEDAIRLAASSFIELGLSPEVLLVGNG